MATLRMGAGDVPMIRIPFGVALGLSLETPGRRTRAADPRPLGRDTAAERPSTVKTRPGAKA